MKDWEALYKPYRRQLREMALLVDFWRAQATENMKRALRAEAMLARLEGRPIDDERAP